MYIVINSYCMQNFGLTDYRSAIINTVFSVMLLVLIISLKSTSYYGLTKVTNLKQYLYFIPTMMQIGYAISMGYLFVIIFYKSNSLIPCIIAHGVNNALSIFNVENERSMYIAPVFLMVVPLIYAAYINKTVKE